MTQQDLLNDFISLPVDAQRQVTDFISFLRQKYQTQVPVRGTDAPLQDDKFIGMWSDRQELTDSTDWVRTLRNQEWSR